MSVLSDEERAERKKLVGYCEPCDTYTKFNSETDKPECENCGGKFSNKQGFQLTTQRTFVPKKKGRK